jgi:hypothetical protein
MHAKMCTPYLEFLPILGTFIAELVTVAPPFRLVPFFHTYDDCDPHRPQLIGELSEASSDQFRSLDFLGPPRILLLSRAPGSSSTLTVGKISLVS